MQAFKADALSAVFQQFFVQNFGEIRRVQVLEVLIEIGDRPVRADKYAVDIVIAIAQLIQRIVLYSFFEKVQ